jgi:hypothetical protein
VTRALCIILFGVLGIVSGQDVLAADPSDLCRAASASAAEDSGVPADVLLAISLTETGRDTGDGLAPWPWAINAGGEGHWFPDRATAVRFAEELQAAGRTNFDVGCFQLNLRWHGDAFESIDAMFDPEANARYAARFLADLAGEGGGWSVAAGAYHSRTPEHAQRYRDRFEEIRADLGDMPVAPLAPSPGSDEGPGYSHPLLQARDAPRTPGSLVPLGPVPAT